MTEFSFSPSSCCIESFLNSVVAGNLDYASNINPQYNTLAIYNAETGLPDISYSDVKITTFQPAKRVYGAEAEAAEAAKKAKEAAK